MTTHTNMQKRDQKILYQNRILLRVGQQNLTTHLNQKAIFCKLDPILVQKNLLPMQLLHNGKTNLTFLTGYNPNFKISNGRKSYIIKIKPYLTKFNLI